MVQGWRASLVRMFLIALAVVPAGACTGSDGPESAAGEQPAPAREPAPPGTGPPAGDFDTGYTIATERYADALAEVQATGIEAVASDPVGAHDVYDRLREVTEHARGELAALTPPGHVAEDHARVLGLLEAQVEALAGAVAASRVRDDRTLETNLARYADLLAEWREAHGGLSNRLEGS